MNRQILLFGWIFTFLLGTMSGLNGDDSAWLSIIKRGGVQRVKVDDKGELQSFVVVGTAVIKQELELALAKRDAQTRACLDAKNRLVRWMGQSVVSIEESKTGTVIVVENGKESVRSTTNNITIYNAFAENVVTGTRPLYVLERTVGNDREYCLVLGWSKKELKNTSMASSGMFPGDLPMQGEAQDMPVDEERPFDNERFADIHIRPGYLECLLADALVMELGGARVYALPGGVRYLIAVGSTVVKQDSPAEILRREKVAMAKAKANLQKLSGVKVTSITRYNEQVKIIEDSDGNDRYERIENLFESTREQSQGLVRQLPVIGKWYSKDRKLYYVAVGCALSQR